MMDTGLEVVVDGCWSFVGVVVAVAVGAATAAAAAGAAAGFFGGMLCGGREYGLARLLLLRNSSFRMLNLEDSFQICLFYVCTVSSSRVTN